MKQTTRDILAAMIVLWIVGAIVSAAFGNELLAAFLWGVPAVIGGLTVLVSAWAFIAGRLE